MSIMKNVYVADARPTIEDIHQSKLELVGKYGSVKVEGAKDIPFDTLLDKFLYLYRKWFDDKRCERIRRDIYNAIFYATTVDYPGVEELFDFIIANGFNELGEDNEYSKNINDSNILLLSIDLIELAWLAVKFGGKTSTCISIIADSRYNY